MSHDEERRDESLHPIPWEAFGLRSTSEELAVRGLDLLDRVEKTPAPAVLPFSVFQNSLGMRFIFLPAGAFAMGSPANEPERKDYETLHRVTLSRGFHLQSTLVSVDEWRAFVRATGHVSRAETKGGAFVFLKGRWVQKEGCYWDTAYPGQSGEHPVTCISWHEAREFARWLTLREGLPYRLPTEAEWEYACRAGASSRFCFGEEERFLGDYAWYWANSDKKPHPVAQKRPNVWGLYDMHGNVWELCEDRCDWRREKGHLCIVTDTFADGITDPVGTKGKYRIARGGDCLSPARSCRAAKRLICAPKSTTTVRGFRLALGASAVFRTEPGVCASVEKRGAGMRKKNPLTPPGPGTIFL